MALRARLAPVAVAVLTLWLMPTAPAMATPFAPPELAPGSQYQLVFVTSGVRDAQNGNIAVYNAFVNAQAELSGSHTAGAGISWFAIASTPTADARDNAPVSAPVFLLDGTKVADGFSDFWDGSLDANINLTQFGSSTPLYATWYGEYLPLVWTGTMKSGVGASDNQQLGGTQASYVVGRTDFDPSLGDWIRTGATTPSDEFAFYALSEVLTTPPVAVPDPGSTLLLLGTGLATLASVSRRWRR